MKRTTARWTTVLAAAALIALPASGLAQTDPPAQPPAQPPATAQPPTPSEPAQQPAQPNASQEAAKQHLTAARDTLAQLTKLPAASQLSGDARAQVSQLINNFNELITTKADWQAAYAKVEANLNTLLGPNPNEPARPPSGTPGAVGTSGAAGLDPSVRAKLVEFRTHLEQFEKAANPPQPAAMATPPPAATTPPATPPTTPPATPPTTPPTAPPTTPPATPPTTTPPTEPDEDEIVPISPKEALKHIEAIEAIVSTQAPLSPAQVDQLKMHVSELKRLIEKK
jgi:hypothetical protein